MLCDKTIGKMLVLLLTLPECIGEKFTVVEGIVYVCHSFSVNDKCQYMG